MKGNAAFVIAVAFVLASAASAGINPLSPGLVARWTTTAERGYGVAEMTGNPASAMCVECHGVNPSSRIAEALGGIDPRSAEHRGTHFVMNTLATGSSTPLGTTHSGGGFPGGYGAQPRDGGEYLKTTAWDAGSAPTDGYSRYGLGTDWGTVDPTNADFRVEDADLICESCHNVLRNVGESLLLAPWAETGGGDSDRLCVGCHSAGGGREDYAGFHANGNIPNFNGSARRRHHLLEGDVVTAEFYDPDGDPGTADSVMWAPGFTRLLSARWCDEPFSAEVRPVELSFPLTPTFRGLCNVSGAGTYNGPLPGGEILTGTQLRCGSCHRPHNAQTGSGAFVLRSGTGRPLNPEAATGSPDVYGITRQFDVGDRALRKVYGEYGELCGGCHQGYGGQR